MSGIRLTNAESVALWQAVNGATIYDLERLSSKERRIVTTALKNMSNNKIEKHNISNISSDVGNIIQKLEKQTKTGQSARDSFIPRITLAIANILGFRPSTDSILEKSQTIKASREIHQSKINELSANDIHQLKSTIADLEKKLKNKLTTPDKKETRNQIKNLKSKLKKLEAYQKDVSRGDSKLTHQNLENFKELKH